MNEGKEYYFLKDLRIFFVSVPVVFLIILLINITIFNLYEYSNVGAQFAVFIVSTIIVYYANSLYYITRHTGLADKSWIL